MAHYDLLTGLPNRAHFIERLLNLMVRTVQTNEFLVLIYLDLDDFDVINDKFGQTIGNGILTTTASRLNLVLREHDMLARLDGDAFIAVLVRAENTVDFDVPLNQFLTIVARPVPKLLGEVHRVSASMGVTFYPQHETVDVNQLLRQSEMAMCQAKLAGKCCYRFFDVEQDLYLRGNVATVQELRCALDRSQLVLHYQPKVNLRDGKVVGAEALIRWQHPRRGLLQPAAFLELIENHPLAVDLGEWAIGAALKQRNSWKKVGLDIPISVNIGAYQVQKPDFASRLQAILASHRDFTTGDLELELVETSALYDLTRLAKVIGVCRGLGVNFAIDDFGTGYSSLAYLQHLPIGSLKIDRSFVGNMLEDSTSLPILAAVIKLAIDFHLSVIAEGVETPEQAAFLMRLGCDLAQGYGIARPMPGHAIPDWADVWLKQPVWQVKLAHDMHVSPPH
jgi:diguanylate cyclase (GGDEF)-like protein